MNEKKVGGGRGAHFRDQSRTPSLRVPLPTGPSDFPQAELRKLRARLAAGCERPAKPLTICIFQGGGGVPRTAGWCCGSLSLHNTTAAPCVVVFYIYTRGGSIWRSLPPPVKTVTISLLTTRRKLLGWARILKAEEVIQSHERRHHMLRGCQLLMCMGKALVPVCKAQECTLLAAVCTGTGRRGDLGCHFFSSCKGNLLGGARCSKRGLKRSQSHLKLALGHVRPGQIVFL